MNEDMDHEIEDLAALDAAGLLGADERIELARALADAPADVRQRVAALYDTAAAVALEDARAAAPSEALKQRLLARATGQPTAAAGAAREPFLFRDKDAGAWRPLGAPGMWWKPLAQDRDRYAMFLLRYDAGARLPEHHHTGDEQCLVISGEIVIDGRRLGPGDFHTARADSDHGITYSDTGCVVLIVASPSDYAAAR